MDVRDCFCSTSPDADLLGFGVRLGAYLQVRSRRLPVGAAGAPPCTAAMQAAFLCPTLTGSSPPPLVVHMLAGQRRRGRPAPAPR